MNKKHVSESSVDGTSFFFLFFFVFVLLFAGWCYLKFKYCFVIEFTKYS